METGLLLHHGWTVRSQVLNRQISRGILCLARKMGICQLPQLPGLVSWHLKSGIRRWSERRIRTLQISKYGKPWASGTKLVSKSSLRAFRWQVWHHNKEWLRKTYADIPVNERGCPHLQSPSQNAEFASESCVMLAVVTATRRTSMDPVIPAGTKVAIKS